MDGGYDDELVFGFHGCPLELIGGNLVGRGREEEWGGEWPFEFKL
jgi:hypothetical protein